MFSFDSAISQYLDRRLQKDGSFVLGDTGLFGGDDSSSTITQHEILAHLQSYGAYELARSARYSGRVREGLLALGVEISAPDCQGQTALLYALEMGRARIMNSYPVSKAIAWLLESGADPNRAGKDGQTPLQLATALNFVSVVRDLRQAGAVNAGRQTLETAPQEEPECSRDAVQVFLALGGDLEAPCGGSMQDLNDDEALFYRKYDTISMAAEHDSRTSWLHAAQTGDLPMLQALHAAGADRSAFLWTDERGALNAVALAACGPHVDAVRQLLEWNVPTRAAQEFSCGAIDCCIESHDNRLVAKSLEKNVDPDLVVEDCVRLLLEFGDRPGSRAFVTANQDLRLCEILWPHAPVLTGKEATNALGRICSVKAGANASQHLRFVGDLLKWGADPNANYGRVMEAANEDGDSDLLALLQAAGGRWADGEWIEDEDC